MRDVEGGRKRRRLEALDAHLAKAFCLESRGHGGTRSRVILCRRQSGDSACSMLGVLGLQGTGQEAGNHHFPIVLLSTIRRMAAACVLLLGICLACSFYVLRVALLELALRICPRVWIWLSLSLGLKTDVEIDM